MISTIEPCGIYWQVENLYSGGRQHVSQLKTHFFKHAVQLASVQSYCTVSCVKRCKCTNGTETNCGSTVTVSTSLNTERFLIIQPTGLKLQLDWEMRNIVKLTMKSVPSFEIFVLWCHLTPVSVREYSSVLQHGWVEVDEACWLGKISVQVLYMHKALPWWMLGKMFQRKEIHNKLQLTECSWMNKNGITRNTREIFPILVNGSSNKQILQSNSPSSSSWSTLHYTKCVGPTVIYEILSQSKERFAIQRYLLKIEKNRICRFYHTPSSTSPHSHLGQWGTCRTVTPVYLFPPRTRRPR